jgi:hypothetical protein
MYILSAKLHILIFSGTISCIIKWIIIDSTWKVGDVHTIDLVTYIYTLVLLLSIGIQILEIPICQKNSHVS